MLTAPQREMCSQTYKFNFRLNNKVSLQEQVRSFEGKISELEEVALLLFSLYLRLYVFVCVCFGFLCNC